MIDKPTNLVRLDEKNDELHSVQFELYDKSTLVFSTLGISFLLMLAILIVINYVVVLVGNQDTNELIRISSNLYIEQVRFALWPEPVERNQFLVSLLVMPVGAYLLIPLIEKSIQRSKVERFVYFATAGILVFGVIATVFLAFKSDPANFLVDSPLPYYRDIRSMVDKFVGHWTFISTMLCVFLVANQAIKPWLTKFFVGFCLVLLAGLFLTNLATPATYYGWAEHFNAVFYSLDQVIKGKTLLVNITNQYGLYPHFLEMLFFVVDFNIENLTATFSILTVLAHALIYGFIYRATKSHLASALALSAILYIRFYLFILWNSGDSYFQYNPIRLIFPCLLLYFGQSYLKNRNRFIAVLMSFCASASILWNVDSGVIVFVAWILMLVYDEISRNAQSGSRVKALFQIIFGNVLMLVGVFISYALVMRLRSGDWIDLYQLLKYQRIFYDGGFYMMHMPVFNAWNIVFGIYLFGFLYSIRSLIHGMQDRHYGEVFLTSIIGIGIFSYYQGRSHDYVILAVSYPAIILIALAFGRLDALSSKRPHQVLVYGCSLFSLLLFNVLMLAGVPAAFGAVTSRVTVVYNSYMNDDGNVPRVRVASDFISKNTNPGEVVLILPQPDFNDGILYYLSKTVSPLPVPGGSERVLISDFKEISDFLMQNKTVKVFSSLNYRYAEINNILSENYRVIESNEHIKYFLPRQ